MFVYLDETDSGDKSFCGYGALITKERINNNVIEYALKRLKNDEDRFDEITISQDERTLKRGYFHAADDSKNSHSHLCTSINKNIIGDFSSNFFVYEKSGFSSLKELFDHSSQLAVLSSFSKPGDLTLIFEGRDDINFKSLISEWWPELWRSLCRSCFLSPFIPLYYPNLKIEVLGKNEPGLQVVDFMLWASQRSMLDKGCKWYERLKGWSKSSMSMGDGILSSHSIKKIPPQASDMENYALENYSNEYLTQGINFDLGKIIINVQTVINKSIHLEDKTHIQHFMNDIIFIYKNRVVESNPEFIVKMADCFIKIFDNVKLINKTTPTDDQKFWTLAKKCMALNFHNGPEAFFHTLRASDVRNRLIRECPDNFNIGA